MAKKKISPHIQSSVVAEFDTITDQLRATLLSLEENVRHRTRDLEIASEVSRQIATVLDLDELLPYLANLTKDSFSLYHAHIYLLDETGEMLNLAAGAGDAGRTMVAEGHSISINSERSLVASAARSRSGITSNEVTSDPDFLPNTLLPDTQAEMAVPMIVGQSLIGVLDVQAATANAFDQNNLDVMQVLASQMAVAVQNARTFTQVERARTELELVYQNSVDMIGSAGFNGYFTFLNPAWEKTLGYTREELMAAPFVSFVHEDDVDMTNAEAAKIGEGATALQFTNRYRAKSGEYHWVSWNATPDMQNQLIHFVARDITEEYNAAKIREALFEISEKLNAAQDPQAILDAIVPYAAENQANIVSLNYIDEITDEHDGMATLVGSWVSSPEIPAAPVGTRFPLADNLFSRLWLSNPDKVVLISDVQHDERIDPEVAVGLKGYGIQAMALIPLHTGNRWVGS